MKIMYTLISPFLLWNIKNLDNYLSILCLFYLACHYLTLYLLWHGIACLYSQHSIILPLQELAGYYNNRLSGITLFLNKEVFKDLLGLGNQSGIHDLSFHNSLFKLHLLYYKYKISIFYIYFLSGFTNIILSGIYSHNYKQHLSHLSTKSHFSVPFLSLFYLFFSVHTASFFMLFLAVLYFYIFV